MKPDIHANSIASSEMDARYVATINAICADIRDIYRIDCDTETITPIRQDFRVEGLIEDIQKKAGYNEAVLSYVENNVFVKDRQMLLDSLRMSNIRSLLKKNETLSFFYRVFRKNELHYFRLKCVRLGDAEHFNTMIYAFMPEDFETSQAQMLHVLETDEVTGIYTKQAFYHYAPRMLDENPDKPYDLIVTDIENFKLVNRTYGRNAGDQLLRYLAQRFTNAARSGICAHYGADRFVILCEHIEEAEYEAFYLQHEDMRRSAPLPYLMLRYGIYQNVDRSDSIADMCDKALLALRSKRSYRGKPAMFYDRVVIQNHLRTQMFEAQFERALAGHEFVIWCQPKYNAFTKRITSAEALIRWQISDGNFISPGEFIPVFESNGLIVRLDEYVFRFVCAKQRALIDEGIEPIPISVNMSRATLYTPGSIERYRDIIDRMGVPKELVPLEVTESATVENVQIGGLIDNLKAAGFVLHMDDFGSGYSSLASLASLHFDVLKLDKTLIDGIGNKRGDEILRHIIELAHFFQMEVVAEGVERNEQYAFLKKLNCDTIQGYLFCRPIPYDQYIELFASRPEEETALMDDSALAEEASVGSLRITNDLKMQYLSALARIYMTMHVIDLKEDTVVEFATTTNVKAHCNRVHDAAGQMKASMTATVAPEYLEAVLAFTDLTTIVGRMRGKRTISAEFVGKHFGWFRARFIVITANENDEPEKIIYTTQVIEADKREGDSLVRACHTDVLTGVYNLAAFEEDVRLLAGSSQAGAPDLCILIADIDNVRAINEQYGRLAGDEVIWGTADILNTIFGKKGSVYRIDGDRFAAIFHADAKQLEKLRDAYEDSVSNWIGNEIRKLSTSYGIVSRREFPDACMNTLLQEADRRRQEYKAAHARLNT